VFIRIDFGFRHESLSPSEIIFPFASLFINIVEPILKNSRPKPIKRISVDLHKGLYVLQLES
jgi:hypothetical protein